MRYLILILLVFNWLNCERDRLHPTVDDTPYIYDLPPGFPLPSDPAENPITAAKVALGKRLFYDPILSRDSSISCNSCHIQDYGFADTVAISVGVDGRMGFRNAATLTNLAYVTVFHKGGGVPKLDLQAGTPIEDELEMDLPLHLAAERLNADPTYEQQFYQAYGRPASAFTITRALAAFQRTLISGNSAYDRYTFGGETGALTAAQLRGMTLFFSEDLACAECHSGFNFTNNDFYNTGTKLDYTGDPGRFRVTIDSLDLGKFKVPTLRNIAVTAPYLHDGSVVTLAEMVAHYNQGGLSHPLQDARIRPLNLSAQSQADLVAFLTSLTDEQFLQDEKHHPE